MRVMGLILIFDGREMPLASRFNLDYAGYGLIQWKKMTSAKRSKTCFNPAYAGMGFITRRAIQRFAGNRKCSVSIPTMRVWCYYLKPTWIVKNHLARFNSDFAGKGVNTYLLSDMAMTDMAHVSILTMRVLE